MPQFNFSSFIPQLSIDSVILGYKEKELKVLVSKFNFANNLYGLPGGFIDQNESIDQAALRILKERTGLTDIYLEQYHTFGGENRTNLDLLDNINYKEKSNNLQFSEADTVWLGRRFVSIGYYALVDIGKVNPQKSDLDESIDWYAVDDLPNVIMDHKEMVGLALETLRENLDKKLSGFNLLPETFTMRELQELYEAVYDKPFARNNFQKKMLDLNVLERLEKKFTGAANKAPYLYRFLRQ